MTHEAMKKINTEMQKAPDDTYREIIGQYIIDRCVNEDVANLVMKQDKTLEGAMKAVEAAARNKAHNRNCVCMLPVEVFGAVDKYFDLQTDELAQERAMRSACTATADPVEPPVAKRVALDLGSFL